MLYLNMKNQTSDRTKMIAELEARNIHVDQTKGIRHLSSILRDHLRSEYENKKVSEVQNQFDEKFFVPKCQLWNDDMTI